MYSQVSGCFFGPLRRDPRGLSLRFLYVLQMGCNMWIAFKTFMFTSVVIMVLFAHSTRQVVEPEIATDIAIKQLDSDDRSIEELRAYQETKHGLDWMWIVVPVSAVLLFGRDVWCYLNRSLIHEVPTEGKTE